ncbi:tail fiber assembly protein [Pseudomonas japonica]|uniref:Virus tail fibre assembly protein, lambda gpK n=1 Tax=Pseudomonas japonica TaxID=256466 RepID=A0A239FDZ6_9PSED|nr:tail assembly chaperone [Pseudomonas japonica]SNS55139.1 virus tail fibre assembly protein, lambda gpK [Pseudomonas japonica]
MTAPTIYHAHPMTGEYLGQGIADPDPMDKENWLIPGFAYLDAPPEVPTLKVARRSGDKSSWEVVDDYRGPVYSTSTGEVQEYTRLGSLPEGLTLHPRPAAFYRWNGTAWELDKLAQLVGARADALTSRDERLALATMRIAPLEDAVYLQRATETEKEQLLAWKTYRMNLGRIEQLDGFPLAFEWPPSPDGEQTDKATD